MAVKCLLGIRYLGQEVLWRCVGLINTVKLQQHKQPLHTFNEEKND